MVSVVAESLLLQLLFYHLRVLVLVVTRRDQYPQPVKRIDYTLKNQVYDTRNLRNISFLIRSILEAYKIV